MTASTTTTDEHLRTRIALLVIGIGNRDRGDDAAGPAVCDRLRARCPGAPAIRTVVHEASTLDLAMRWEPVDDVILVDAMQPDTEPGRVLLLDATTGPLPTVGALSTHEIDVSVAVELARAIDRMPARLRLIGIEAAQSTWGAPLSPAVDAAVDRVVESILGLVSGSPSVTLVELTGVHHAPTNVAS